MYNLKRHQNHYNDSVIIQIYAQAGFATERLKCGIKVNFKCYAQSEDVDQFCNF